MKSHFQFFLCSHKSFQVLKRCCFIYFCFQVRLVEDDWLHSGSLICPPCNEVNFAKLYFDFSLISLINYRFVSLTFDSPPAMWRAVRSGGFPVQGRDHAPTGPLLPGAPPHLWSCSPPSPCPPPSTPPATTSSSPLLAAGEVIHTEEKPLLNSYRVLKKTLSERLH